MSSCLAAVKTRHRSRNSNENEEKTAAGSSIMEPTQTLLLRRRNGAEASISTQDPASGGGGWWSVGAHDVTVKRMFISVKELQPQFQDAHGPRRLRHPPSTKGDGLGQQPAGAGPRTCPEPVYPRPAWCAVGCNMMLYVQHRRSCRASSTSSPGDGRRSASEQWARCHERRLRRLHVDRWLRGSKVALC